MEQPSQPGGRPPAKAVMEDAGSPDQREIYIAPLE